ncbi:hypothetical protein ACEQ8H_002841 [Pleosporales sp. CAS-2024a]
MLTTFYLGPYADHLALGGLYPKECELNPNRDELDPLDNYCCICYTTYSHTMKHSTAEKPVKLACRHQFGDMCLSKWISTQTEPHDENLSSDEEFGSPHERGYMSANGGESEAGNAALDAYNKSVPLYEDRHLRSDDVWLAVAVDEENASLYTRLKPGFPVYTNPTVSAASDDSFEELVSSHKDWMARSLDENESDDEYSITYCDVFPY